MPTVTNRKGALGIIVIVIVIILIALGFVLLSGDEDGDGDIVIDTSDWETYTNDEFDIELRHPRDWKVVATTTVISPVINVVPENATGTPFTHHSQKTQVSIFPEGIPTEGVIGETEESRLALNIDTQEGLDYVLDDGTVWARMFQPANSPESWGQPGFIWAEVQVQDLKVTCTRDGEVITSEQCDPLGSDDQIIRSGTVDVQTRRIEEQILLSISFTTGTTTPPANGNGGNGDGNGNGNGDQNDDQNGDVSNLIDIDNPSPNELVSSPLLIRGEARGNWFFEASFPARIEDANGNVLTQFSIETSEDWMTTDFVSFEKTVTFSTNGATEGVLILEKSNPSGLPENEAELRIPIRFQ